MNDRIFRWSHWFLKLTIGKEILVALLCTALIPTVILGLYGGWQLNRFTEEKIISYNRELLTQVGRKLDYLAGNVEAAQKQLIAHIISSPLFYRRDELNIIERIESIKKTQGLLNTLRQIHPFIHSLYLIDSQWNVYSSLNEFNKEKLLNKHWIIEIRSVPYEFREVPLHPSDYASIGQEESTESTMSFVRKISLTGNRGDGAIIQVDLAENVLRGFLDEFPLEDGGFLRLMNEDTVLMIYKSGLRKPKKMHQLSYRLSNINWTLQSGVPIDRHPFGKEMPIWIFTVLCASVLILSVIISIMVSRRITGPLYSVIGAMDQLGDGNLSHHLPEPSNSDLSCLVNGINRMSDRLQMLITNAELKEKEKNRARLNALQAQINPHFLYNTLDVVRGISQASGNDDVVFITASLAKVFRYSVGSEEMVPIEMELENTKNYLTIQHYRFPNRFRVEYRIDPMIPKCRTVKSVLQPLVENAFRHSLEEFRGEGLLILHGRTEGGMVKLVVENNGPSISTEKADSLNRFFGSGASIEGENSRNSSRTGLGLHNVDTRLKLHFGKSSGVEILPREGGGTAVSLSFPRFETV